MAKRGRPKKPVKERLAAKTLDYSKVTQLARLGMTDEEFAAFFGITRMTWHRWKREDGDLLLHLEKGREESDAIVADRLFQRAIGYKHKDTYITQYRGQIVTKEIVKHYPPDTGAAAFWLKNRRPDKWRDRPAKEDPDDSQVAELLAKLNAMVQDSEEYTGPEEEETDGET